MAAVRALSGAGSGLRWGMLLVAVAGIAAAAADEPDDSMEELPNQRLLEDVVAALLPDSPRVRMERRARTSCPNEARGLMENTYGWELNDRFGTIRNCNLIIKKVANELKPNAESAISAGRRQLRNYIKVLNGATGGKPWEGHLDTYNPDGSINWG